MMDTATASRLSALLKLNPAAANDGGINYVNGDLEGPTADILQGTIGADVFFGGELADTFVIDGEYGEAYELDTILDYSENDTINLDEIFRPVYEEPALKIDITSSGWYTNSWILNVELRTDCRASECHRGNYSDNEL